MAFFTSPDSIARMEKAWRPSTPFGPGICGALRPSYRSRRVATGYNARRNDYHNENSDKAHSKRGGDHAAAIHGHGPGPGRSCVQERLLGLARLSSTDPKGRNGDSRRIDPGQTLTLMDVKGSGRVTHIWFTINSPSPEHLRELVLRMTWDDAARPAVECPVGDFFAQGHAKYVEFQSAAVVVGSAMP